MRLIFATILFLLLFSQDCIAQQTIYNSTRLLERGEKYEPLVLDSAIVMNNALIIANDKFSYSFRYKLFELNSAEKVRDFINSYKIDTIKEKVYIVCDTNSTYKSIVDILDVFMQSNILDYQIIDNTNILSTEVSKPIMSESKKVSTSLPTLSVLSIEIGEKDFKVILQGQKTRFTTYKSLEKYLLENQPSLKKYRIELIAPSNLDYKRYKPIIELLKTLEIYDFSMTPK